MCWVRENSRERRATVTARLRASVRSQGTSCELECDAVAHDDDRDTDEGTDQQGVAGAVAAAEGGQVEAADVPHPVVGTGEATHRERDTRQHADGQHGEHRNHPDGLSGVLTGHADHRHHELGHDDDDSQTPRVRWRPG